MKKHHHVQQLYFSCRKVTLMVTMILVAQVVIGQSYDPNIELRYTNATRFTVGLFNSISNEDAILKLNNNKINLGDFETDYYIINSSGKLSISPETNLIGDNGVREYIENKTNFTIMPNGFVGFNIPTNHTPEGVFHVFSNNSFNDQSKKPEYAGEFLFTHYVSPNGYNINSNKADINFFGGGVAFSALSVAADSNDPGSTTSIIGSLSLNRLGGDVLVGGSFFGIFALKVSGSTGVSIADALDVNNSLTIGTLDSSTNNGLPVENATLTVDGPMYISETTGSLIDTQNIVSNYPDVLAFIEEGVVSNDFAIADVTEWPDYVFESNYQLPSLSDIEMHIKKK